MKLTHSKELYLGQSESNLEAIWIVLLSFNETMVLLLILEWIIHL